MRAIDRLKAAADLALTERKVTLGDGSEFSLWASNLTMAEREKSQKDAKSDDANQYALQLLINKAKEQDGSPMFAGGDVAALKRDCEDGDLQAIMMLVIGRAEGEIGTKRTKSVTGGDRKGSVDAAPVLGS